MSRVTESARSLLYRISNDVNSDVIGCSASVWRVGRRVDPPDSARFRGGDNEAS